MTTLELTKVELRHLRDILVDHAQHTTLCNAALVSMNSLLVKAGAEPLEGTEYYSDVEKRLLPLQDEPDPTPGYLVRGGYFYVAVHGWTERRDCAQVFDQAGAEWQRDFELRHGHFPKGVEIVPAGQIDEQPPGSPSGPGGFLTDEGGGGRPWS